MKVKGACSLQADVKGILKVYMPDGTEIPMTAGREIRQDLIEAKAGICLVKLNIYCNVEPSDRVITADDEDYSFRSFTEIIDEINRLGVKVGQSSDIQEKETVQDIAMLVALRWVLGIEKQLL